MFKVIWTLGLSLIPLSAATYSGPFSYLEKLECVIAEKCDFQMLCKKTSEQTEVILTQLVYEEPFSIEYYDKPWELVKDVEYIAWIDFAHPTIRVPLPVWYQLETEQEVGDPSEFRLKDWLSGRQVSPYDSKDYALVMTGDLDAISYSRANLDKDDDLPWQITVYEKHGSENGQYRTQTLLCDSDW